MTRVTKISLIALSVLLVVGSGLGYWFFLYEPPKTERPKRDPYAFAIPPVAHPMNGYVMNVPDEPETSVVLDMIAPSTRRDYPMGQFTVASGTGVGTLHVIDDMASPIVSGMQVVPMVVKTAGTGEFVYLAILDTTSTPPRHQSSVLLGDRIRINTLSLQDGVATVQYLVHDRGQALTDIPTVTTTAIVDVKNATFVQEGRKPWLEEVIEYKNFAGSYQWKETRSVSGVVAPSVPDTFTLKFDTNRITLDTDCNSASADFEAPIGSSTAITFTNLAQTRMFCQSAEEGPYFEMVQNIVAFSEEENTIIFTLNDDSEMEFVKIGQELEYANP